ncbi:very-short-patch-repair endonuclease [Enterobacter sp. AG5470]|nr:very-short-patch-repair endonuclease [Enterobacter sp. AG5470]
MEKITHARALRKALTPQERQLWRQLRSRRFACYKFRRQHPIGPWIVDFACCEARLVIELDGGQHEEQRGYDNRRTRWLEAEGWKLLRFWNNELARNEEGMMMRILDVLQVLLPSPRPSPWKGEGEKQR